MNNNPLSILIDRELSSVEFVRDYLQIRFDGPVLTAFSDPELIVAGTIYKTETKEFCYLLTRCIGQVVVMATVEEGGAIRLGFRNGVLLNISLKTEDRLTVEAATFDDNLSGGWWVW